MGAEKQRLGYTREARTAPINDYSMKTESFLFIATILSKSLVSQVSGLKTIERKFKSNSH